MRPDRMQAGCAHWRLHLHTRVAGAHQKPVISSPAGGDRLALVLQPDAGVQPNCCARPKPSIATGRGDAGKRRMTAPTALADCTDVRACTRACCRCSKISCAQSRQAPHPVATCVALCSAMKSVQPCATSRAISRSETLWHRQTIMDWNLMRIVPICKRISTASLDSDGTRDRTDDPTLNLG